MRQEAPSREALWFLALGLALALYYYSPWALPTALGAALFIALAWMRLDLALLFVLFSAPFYLFPKAFGNLSFSLTEFTVLACFLAWAGRALVSYLRGSGLGMDFPPKWRPWSSPALFFLFTATVSLPFSQYLHFSLREYRVVILEPLLFYIMLITTLRGERAVWRMINAFVALGAAMSLAALYHYYFVGVVEATGGVRRMLAIYHSPNALALFLGRVFPVALALALGARTGTGEPSFPQRGLSARIRAWVGGQGPRWPYFVAVFLIGISILFTFSRGAWFGMGIAVLFIAALRGRWALLVLASAGGAMLLAALPFLRLGRLVSGVTTSQRLYVWQSALHMIRDRPLTGVGLDNFLYYYRERGYRLPQAWAEPNVSHPHNILLDYWTRLGVLGVASLAWLQLSFWRRAWGLYRRLGTDASPSGGLGLSLVLLALMASMVDFLVHGLVDNSFFLIDLAVVFWLTYGLVEVISKEAGPCGP
jgi:O-antigen ligase